MSVPSIVKGQYFDVAVDVTSLGLPDLTGFVVICGLNTRNLTHQINTSDEAVRDCEQPEQVPWRVVNTTSQQKDMSGTGLHNRAQTNVLRAIFGKKLPYRFIEGEPGDDLVSQGYWEGDFVFSNWQEGASDGTNVSSQMTWLSDGEVIWVSTIAPVLANLTLSDVAANAGDLWSATITGRMPGSTVTATASDGTILTVVGATVSGTFEDAGTPTVTLVESNAEASNSPHSTPPITITVSA